MQNEYQNHRVLEPYGIANRLGLDVFDFQLVLYQMNTKTGKQNRFSSFPTSLKMLNIAKAIYALFAS